MLLKMPYEIKTDNIKLKMLIYGQPGIGKSTLALSMPDPVFIDADNGVHRINVTHRVPTLQVTSYQEVLDLVDSDELNQFGTIVIDTAGKLLDYINAHIIAENPKLGNRGGQLSMQGWGVRASTFGALLKSISVMGKHLVFVAHEKEDKDGDSRIIRPDFGGGKAGSELIKDIDAVGYMEAVGHKRTISFSPSDRYYAKNSARLDDILEIPALNASAPNNFLTQLAAKFESAMSEESKRLKDYSALMADIEGKAGAVTDARSANAFVKEIGTLPEIWDSRIKARNIFRAKVTALGLKFDEAKKEYCAPEAPAEKEVA